MVSPPSTDNHHLLRQGLNRGGGSVAELVVFCFEKREKYICKNYFFFWIFVVLLNIGDLTRWWKVSAPLGHLSPVFWPEPQSYTLIPHCSTMVCAFHHPHPRWPNQITRSDALECLPWSTWLNGDPLDPPKWLGLPGFDLGLSFSMHPHFLLMVCPVWAYFGSKTQNPLFIYLFLLFSCDFILISFF